MPAPRPQPRPRANRDPGPAVHEAQPAGPEPPQPAVVDKLQAAAPVCQWQPQNRPDCDKLRLAGAVCAFEPVRGRGDGEITRLAGRQHGHVHLEQLRAAAIGRHALAHRVSDGWLQQVCHRVYAVSGHQLTLAGRCMAAALYLRGDGVVTGRAAAQLWGLLDSTQSPAARDPIDVLLVGRTAAPLPGIRIHRSRSLTRDDVRRRNGIPLSSPARTLLDLAGGLDVLELEAVLAAAARLRLVRASELADVIARNPRARGVARLRTLADGAAAPRDTRSVYERRLLRLLAAAELPLPVTNVRVAGALVDGFWPELGLVLEVDGWLHHHQRGQFERDRLRDQIQVASGHRTLRVTAWQIDHHPYALVARVAAVIARLRAGGSGASAGG